MSNEYAPPGESRHRLWVAVAGMATSALVVIVIILAITGYEMEKLPLQRAAPTTTRN